MIAGNTISKQVMKPSSCVRKMRVENLRIVRGVAILAIIAVFRYKRQLLKPSSGNFDCFLLSPVATVWMLICMCVLHALLRV